MTGCCRLSRGIELAICQFFFGYIVKMVAAKPKPIKEQPIAGANPCLGEMPYRALVFARLHGSTPLYFVAGSPADACGAEKALKAAFKIHGGNCFYCKTPLKDGEMTLDHVEPVKIGGDKSLQNLVLSCKPCNAAKGHRPIEAFKPDAGREWLSALLQQVQDRLNKIST